MIHAEVMTEEEIHIASMYLWVKPQVGDTLWINHTVDKTGNPPNTRTGQKSYKVVDIAHWCWDHSTEEHRESGANICRLNEPIHKLAIYVEPNFELIVS